MNKSEAIKLLTQLLATLQSDGGENTVLVSVVDHPMSESVLIVIESLQP